jgi:hypothetical protein
MRALYVNVPEASTADAGTMDLGNGTKVVGWLVEDTAGTAANTSQPPPLVAAAAAPLAPPKEWFDADEPDRPEPLTVEEDGRIHGHLALWDACHVGVMNGQMAECVRPPRSNTAYQGFHLGQLVTEDGTPISVGKIVYDGSHASLTADLVGATQHYDKTGKVAAFVKARDGQHGIYLTGATRSDLSPEGLRDLRANPPSGDWRNLRGKLEMIAALAVPIPGYQTPQLAMTASGAVEAMILPGYCVECAEEEEVEEMDRADKAYIRQRSLIASSLDEEALVAAPLTSARRKKLATRVFAIPEERKFPIHDASHARNALARASGTQYEARVRRAVCRRYPSMGECAKK